MEFNASKCKVLHIGNSYAPALHWGTSTRTLSVLQTSRARLEEDHLFPGAAAPGNLPGNTAIIRTCIRTSWSRLETYKSTTKYKRLV